MSIMVLSLYRTNGIKKIISSLRSRRHNVYSPVTARGAGFYYSTLNRRRLARDSFMVVKAPLPIFITRNDRSTFNRARNIIIIILFNSARTYAYIGTWYYYTRGFYIILLYAYAASYFIYYYYYINSGGLNKYVIS